MKRRVIKQGHNTLTVTLPKEWVSKNNIKPGDEIDIAIKDKSLIINTDKGPELSSTIVDVSGLTPPLIWRFISSAYRAGYDEIRVIGIESGKKNLYTAFSYDTVDYLRQKDMITMSPIEVVQAVTNRLIGVEIIDQKEKYCTIKDLGETTYKEFDNSLRRIFHLLKNEMEIVRSGFEGNKNELRSIHLIDTNLDRFEDFCFRVLNKKGYENFRKTSTVYNIVFMLEMLGDQIKKVAIHIMEFKIRNPKILIDSLQKNYEQLNNFINLFYDFKKEKAKEIFETGKKHVEILESHEKKLNQNEKEILYHLKKIASHILSLLELRIDMEY